MMRTLALSATASAVFLSHGDVAAANKSSAVFLSRGDVAAANKSSSTGSACQCEANNVAWKKPAAGTPAACVFIDLGAGDGETLRVFGGMSSKWKFNYETNGFAKNACSAITIEANPTFAQAATAAGDAVFGQGRTVQADGASTKPSTTQEWPQQGGVSVNMSTTAIYMCDKPAEKFYVDLSGPHAWGSALDSAHDSVSSTNQAVDVRLVNLVRLLVENARPEDTVVVKMDIEGAEWDILPCVANSAAVELIDFLYLENHCPSGVKGDGWCASKGSVGHDKATWDDSIAKLRQAGVQLPQYYSPML